MKSTVLVFAAALLSSSAMADTVGGDFYHEPPVFCDVSVTTAEAPSTRWNRYDLSVLPENQLQIQEGLSIFVKQNGTPTTFDVVVNEIVGIDDIESRTFTLSSDSARPQKIAVAGGIVEVKIVR